MSITPAERGLRKACGKCRRLLTLDHFYIRDSSRYTEDGRRWRMSTCVDCHNRRTMDNAVRRGNRDGDPRYNRARSRARTRLTRLVPELYDRLLDEELAKEGVDPSTRRKVRRPA